MTDVPARSSGVRRGGDRPNSPCGRAATTRRARRSPRGCAGARSGTPTERSCSGPAAGMRWRCGWRPTGPSGRQPAGRPRRSPRRDGGPPRSWPRWTGLPPRPRRRPGYPWVTGQLLLARAEGSRLEGRSDPERWQAAAAAWERLEHPFEAAYARFREAEALLAGGGSRPQAEQAIRRAHGMAVTLGAEPLRREVELLAQRGRLRLQEEIDTMAAPEVPSSPAASLGLTRREVEVLALVAEGRTNRQIGQALFITPRPPASTSQEFWPSWGSPVAVRRPRSRTGSASTSDDPAALVQFLRVQSGESGLSRTARQGCVLEPLCAGDARKRPRSKATTDERFPRSTAV
jgi:hypothetical protein